MNFLEAEAYAAKRKLTLPDDFYAVANLMARAKSFTVSGLTGLTQIERVQKILLKNLKSGGTIEDFRKKVIEEKIGLQLPKGRLANVYRTNIQGAYNAGRFDAQIRASVSHPYLMFDCVLDERLRDEHKALHGMIFHIPSEMEKIRKIYPPLDFQCRCRMRGLTEKQAKRYKNDEKQKAKQHAIEDANRKGFKNGPLSVEEINGLFDEKFNELVLDPLAVDEVKKVKAQVLKEVSTTLKIETIDASELAIIYGADYTDFIQKVTKTKTDKGFSKQARLVGGSITSREAALINLALANKPAITDYLSSLSVGRPKGVIGQIKNPAAYFSHLDAVFANRYSNFTASRQNLYSPGKFKANFKPKNIIGAHELMFAGSDSEWFQKIGGVSEINTLFILSQTGPILNADAILGLHSGVGLLRFNHFYEVSSVAINEKVDGRVWPQVVHLILKEKLSNLELLFIKNYLLMVQEGHNFWEGV